jgi:four helix bundle protein
MGTVKRFEDLDVWQKARQLCSEIHAISILEPLSRDFGLRDQMNRSSGSVMDNIAEGFEREGKHELIQFLSYAKSSAAELRSQLHRAKDRSYLSELEFERLYGLTFQVGKMLGGFMKYVKGTDIKGLNTRCRNSISTITSRKVSNLKHEI